MILLDALFENTLFAFLTQRQYEMNRWDKKLDEMRRRRRKKKSIHRYIRQSLNHPLYCKELSLFIHFESQKALFTEIKDFPVFFFPFPLSRLFFSLFAPDLSLDLSKLKVNTQRLIQLELSIYFPVLALCCGKCLFYICIYRSTTR